MIDDMSMAMPPMIDTHCHLDDHQFASDLEQVIEKSRAVNVRRWILIGYDPDRWDAVIEMAQGIPGMFHTLGVHPACAELWNEETAERLREQLLSSRAVGIGEAGLDFYRDNASYEIQERAFASQLEIAFEMNLPVVIHMRSADDEMLKILSDGRRLPTLLFHSFDGNEELLEFAIATDSYVGVGGLATRQKSENLRGYLTKVPIERIVVETDSPYLVPARQKDRRNQPAQIATIVTMMADYFGIDPHTFAAQTTANAERLFGLPHE